LRPYNYEFLEVVADATVSANKAQMLSGCFALKDRPVSLTDPIFDLIELINPLRSCYPIRL